MSRLTEFKNTNYQSNPCRFKITWKSSTKSFSAYDLVQKVTVDLPSNQFTVVAETITIAGFNQEQNLGIFSNEIKNTKTEKLIVRTKNGILIEGFYTDIKDKLKLLGGNFANNVYVVLKSGETAYIQLSGAPLKVWFELKEKHKGTLLMTNWITIGKDANTGKKGSVTYHTPILTLASPLTAKENEASETAFNDISEYRKSFTQSENQLVLEIPDNSRMLDEPMDMLPY